MSRPKEIKNQKETKQEKKVLKRRKFTRCF